MKQLYLKSIILAIFSIISIKASAVEVDGIYYNLDETAMTAEVTSGSTKYSGAVTIPSTITYGGITYSVTSIGRRAFYGCSGLTSVLIPYSMKSIGTDAFRECVNLCKVIVPSISTWCDISFLNIYSNPLFYAHRIYSDENTEITELIIPTFVERVNDYAFYGCTGLTSIIKSGFLTPVEPHGTGYNYSFKIGKSAFEGCANLSSIEILSHIRKIDDKAFYGCSRLTSITIPNKVKIIGNSSFQGCTGLTSVTIPNSVTSIGSSAFAGCIGLTSVTIPNSVTSIGSSAFAGCIGLTSLTISNSVTSIGYSTFSGCTGLTSITIPNSVTSIGESAFSGCTGLISITIPNSVTSIGSDAFHNCACMTSVIIPSSVTKIAENSFPHNSNIKFYTDDNFEMLIRLWTIDIDPYIIETNSPRFRPIVRSVISTTQTSVTVELENIYENITYEAFIDFCGNSYWYNPKNAFDYNYGISVNSDGYYTMKGLLPDSQYYIYIICSKDGLSYSTSGRSDNGSKYAYTSSLHPTIEKLSNTSSSLVVKPHSFKGDAGIGTFEFMGQIIQDGDIVKYSGLEPGASFSGQYYIDMKYGKNESFSKRLYYYFTLNSNDLILTTSQPKVISAGNVIVAAESNLDDEETNVGFEWRRIDYTSEFPSYTGTAYLYNGTMEGYIRSLYTEKLWKYRPYYTSNAGNTYYGEWMGIDPTNTSYFEPTVHTYANVSVNGNSAEVKGYVQRGTDNVVSKGFAYWEQSQGVKSREAMSSPSKISSLPSNAKTIEVSGSQQVMTASLSNLEYETTYCYVAFVRTSEGDTFYGEEMTFTSGESPYTLGDVNSDKNIDISDVVAMVNHILGNTPSTSFKVHAADINKDGNIDISDVVALVNMILG